MKVSNPLIHLEVRRSPYRREFAAFEFALFPQFAANGEVADAALRIKVSVAPDTLARDAVEEQGIGE